MAENSNLNQKYLDHQKKITRISTEIIQNALNKTPIMINKGNVEHTVPGAERGNINSRRVKINDLNEILSIDLENKICEAESGVNFSDLVKETLKFNLVPMCVSELKGITIGGAVSGCSVESMSYKYGGYVCRCLKFNKI